MTAAMEPVANTPLEQPSAGGFQLADMVFRLREYGIIAVLAILFAITAGIQPRFVAGGNITFILFDTTIYALLALGETLVVVTRNVDLSVGSILGMSAYLSANLFSEYHGIPVIVVFLAGIGIGLGWGIVNGAITTLGHVPGLVVTLATLYIIRGLDELIVGGNEVVAQSLPTSFVDIGKSTVFHVPYLAIGIAIVIAAGAYYLRTFRSGREFYAIGSNPDAARLAGIPIGKRVFTAFAVSGAIAGLAGVLWASIYETIDSTAGTGYELTVIASVVVGGVAIFGGSGSVIGAALGALLLESINVALYVLGISSIWTEAIAGLLLIVAISLDRAILVRLTVALRRMGARRAA
jgi:rhamnose transport system permease protein